MQKFITTDLTRMYIKYMGSVMMSYPQLGGCVEIDGGTVRVIDWVYRHIDGLPGQTALRPLEVYEALEGEVEINESRWEKGKYSVAFYANNQKYEIEHLVPDPRP